MGIIRPRRCEPMGLGETQVSEVVVGTGEHNGGLPVL